MFSKRKLLSTVLLASALLLYTSPLAAALRSKPGSANGKARSAAQVTSPASRRSASTRISSHNPSAVARRRATKGTVRAARSSKPRFHGQQSIDQARTLEIQQRSEERRVGTEGRCR